MWINFKNICMEEVQEVVSGDAQRKSGHILAKDALEINFRPIKYSKTQEGWFVTYRTEDANDPKLHFLDKDKAEAFYKKLCNLILNPVDYIEIDAIEEGAI